MIMTSNDRQLLPMVNRACKLLANGETHKYRRLIVEVRRLANDYSTFRTLLSSDAGRSIFVDVYATNQSIYAWRCLADGITDDARSCLAHAVWQSSKEPVTCTVFVIACLLSSKKETTGLLRVTQDILEYCHSRRSFKIDARSIHNDYRSMLFWMTVTTPKYFHTSALASLVYAVRPSGFAKWLLNAMQSSMVHKSILKTHENAADIGYCVAIDKNSISLIKEFLEKPQPICDCGAYAILRLCGYSDDDYLRDEPPMQFAANAKIVKQNRKSLLAAVRMSNCSRSLVRACFKELT